MLNEAAAIAAARRERTQEGFAMVYSRNLLNVPAPHGGILESVQYAKNPRINLSDYLSGYLRGNTLDIVLYHFLCCSALRHTLISFIHSVAHS